MGDGNSDGRDYIAALGNVLLFCLVFGMSATVDIKCLQAQIRNRNAILTGVFCQFILLPLLGFLVVKFVKMDMSMGLTLLVVTSSPGGSYSNWWCSVFNADLALSVTMTAVSTILSVFILPLNLLLYTKFAYDKDILSNIDWTNLFVALVIVISGIGLGLYCSYRVKSYSFNQIANSIGNISGLLLILFSGTVANVGDDSDSKIWSRPPEFYIAVSLPCVLGLIISNCIGIFIMNLKKPEVVTTAVECCYQNVGIATSLALSMFRGNELNNAMGVPFFYGIVEMWFIGFYCIMAWKLDWTKAPHNAPFCHVIVTSYEVLRAEEDYEEKVEVSLRQDEETPDELVTTLRRSAIEGAAAGDTKGMENYITTYYNYSSSSSECPSSNKKKKKKARKSRKRNIFKNENDNNDDEDSIENNNSNENNVSQSIFDRNYNIWQAIVGGKSEFNNKNNSNNRAATKGITCTDNDNSNNSGSGSSNKLDNALLAHTKYENDADYNMWKLMRDSDGATTNRARDSDRSEQHISSSEQPLQRQQQQEEQAEDLGQRRSFEIL